MTMYEVRTASDLCGWAEMEAIDRANEGCTEAQAVAYFEESCADYGKRLAVEKLPGVTITLYAISGDKRTVLRERKFEGHPGAAAYANRLRKGFDAGLAEVLRIAEEEAKSP